MISPKILPIGAPSCRSKPSLKMNGVASSQFSWGNAYSPSGTPVVADPAEVVVARLTTDIGEAEVTAGAWSGIVFWRLKCAQRGCLSTFKSSRAKMIALDEGSEVTRPEGMPSPIANGRSAMAVVMSLLSPESDEVSKVVCEDNISP